MRNLTYFIAVTVDGFIAGEDGGFDFFPTRGEHLPYLMEEYPETIPAHLRETLGIRGDNRHFDTVLMGRHTYEVGTKLGITDPYPHLRQYVVSGTMAPTAGSPVTLVTHDPVALVRSLKREDGLDIWLCGGASLASALYGEIDELVLKVNPVALGTGMPLFRHPAEPLGLELMEHRVFDGGVAIHRYRVVREEAPAASE